MGLQIAAAKTRAFRAASGAIEQRLPVSWERLRVVKRSSLTATSPRTHGPLQRPRRVYARRWWPDPAIHVVPRMFGSAARAKDLCLQNFAAGRGDLDLVFETALRGWPGQARTSPAMTTRAETNS